MNKIFIVEDEKTIREELSIFLTLFFRIIFLAAKFNFEPHIYTD